MIIGKEIFSNTFKHLARRLQPEDPLFMVRRNTLEVRGIDNLMRAMNWSKQPDLSDACLDRFEYIEDLNQRRRRDAEVLLSSCCNGNPKVILEIGTAHGQATKLIAQHAPQATVYTVNIPPDEIDSGGRNVTFAPSTNDIGRIYREAGCKNVVQILANTANWKPQIDTIDVAFIDGCHDTDFVYNDTKNILEQCRSGSLILWHDFAPNMAHNFRWIHDVCRGVELLFRDGLLKNRILHLQDSWIGLYQVP